MNVFVNENDLMDIIKKFNLITNLKVTIFDNEFNVLAEYPKTHCSFCEYINSFSLGKKLCEESNKKAFLECNKKKSILIYKCHLGLVEVVTPLIKNNLIIGYSMFGQILADVKDEEVHKKIRQLPTNIDFEHAISLLCNVRRHNIEKIKAEAKILEMCSMYFITGEMIDVQYEMLQNRIINYINQHCLSDFSIENICNTFNISRTTLYTIVKKKTGSALMEYVKSLRIEKAKNLLRQGNLSVKQIAYITGFSDSNHLIKTFKKFTGTTPKKYG